MALWQPSFNQSEDLDNFFLCRNSQWTLLSKCSCSSGSTQFYKSPLIHFCDHIGRRSCTSNCSLKKTTLHFSFYLIPKSNGLLYFNSEKRSLITIQGLLRLKIHLNCMTSLFTLVPYYWISTFQKNQFIRLLFSGFCDLWICEICGYL